MEKIFSKNWWRHFQKETDNLNKVIVFRNVLAEEIPELYNHTSRVLRAVHENPPYHTFRYWIDGNEIPFGNLKESFIPPVQNQTLTDWAEEISRNRKIGLILNYCENFSEAFKLYIAAKLAPFMKLHGMPSHGFEVSLFIGNYSHTPLGFHLDQRGHKVIHLQIGPGIKEMYLIPKEVYEQNLYPITQGQKTFHDVDKIIDHAVKYVVEPGDIFYMPHGYYHISKNIGFSISVTVWHENLLVDGLAEKVVLTMARKIFTEEGNSVILSDRSPADDTRYLLKQMRSMINTEEPILKKSVKELLDDTLLEYKYLLHSNNFFVPGNTTRQFPAIELKLRDIVIPNSHYKIFLIENKRKSHIYIQGTKFSFPKNKGIKKVIKRLNTYQKIKVKDLIEPLTQEWSKPVCLEFLKEFYIRGAIEVE